MLAMATVTQADAEPVRKRVRLAPDVPAERPGSREKTKTKPAPVSSSACLARPHPLGLKPLGNLLFDSTSPGFKGSCRAPGLGPSLSRLSDELLLHILSLLDGADLLALQGASRTLFAFARHNQLWKDLYISRTDGRLEAWMGSWRTTYLVQFVWRAGAAVGARDKNGRWRSPTVGIRVPNLYSDVLFQPFYATASSLDHYFSTNARSGSHTPIPRVSVRNDAGDPSPEALAKFFARRDRPAILTGAMEGWPCRNWTMEGLSERFAKEEFRAESVKTSMPVYLAYAHSCERFARGPRLGHEREETDEDNEVADESPLYLFDTQCLSDNWGHRSRPPLVKDEWTVPGVFKEDLFSVLGPERPDYRWLIAGPTRSGSTFHKDPNSTSAWNAVIKGRKGWIMFPPDVTPPGVFVSEDEAEVTSPLSIAEWLHTYYNQARALYGPTAKDPVNRGKMLEGVCHEGEVMYVPSGWWHLVVNLSESVAITQNFVSSAELPSVLHFLKYKADQASGFKRPPRLDDGVQADESGDEDGDACALTASRFERFCEKLKEKDAELLERGLEGMRELARERGYSEVYGRTDSSASGKAPLPTLWGRIVHRDEPDPAPAGDEARSGGFGFGFGFEFEVEKAEEGG